MNIVGLAGLFKDWCRRVVFVLLVLGVEVCFSGGVVGEGKVFVRFCNLRGDEGEILVRVHVVPNSNKPFGWGGWTVYVGDEEGKRKGLEGKWLEPGD